METIDINEVFAQANVVENLKNFAGIDAQNALGMMSPERLAAVVGGKLWIKNMRIYKPKDSNVVTVEAGTSLLIMYNPYAGEGNVVFKNSRILRPCTPSNLFLSEGSITISSPSYDKLSFTFNDDTPSYAYVVCVGW